MAAVPGTLKFCFFSTAFVVCFKELLKCLCDQNPPGTTALPNILSWLMGNGSTSIETHCAGSKIEKCFRCQVISEVDTDTSREPFQTFRGSRRSAYLNIVAETLYLSGLKLLLLLCLFFAVNLNFLT